MRRCAGGLVALVAVAGVGLGACDSDRRAISREDLPDVPAQADHVVALGDDGFDVDDLQVATDELVEVRIVGDDDHGVRAELDDEIVIDTGLLHAGETTVLVFDEPGAYEVVDVTDEDEVLRVESAPAGDG